MIDNVQMLTPHNLAPMSWYPFNGFRLLFNIQQPTTIKSDV